MPRHSLKGNKNIQATLKFGKRYYSQTLTLYHNDNIPDLTRTYGVAFLISAKAGRAVERNKIKRWLREDFRQLQGIKSINGAFVIRFNGTADNVNHRQLNEELKELFNSIVVDES